MCLESKQCGIVQFLMIFLIHLTHSLKLHQKREEINTKRYCTKGFHDKLITLAKTKRKEYVKVRKEIIKKALAREMSKEIWSDS